MRGTLAMAYAVAKSEHTIGPRRGFVVPWESADEAALVGGIPIFPARTLLHVVEHLRADAGDASARAIVEHQAMVRLTPPTYPDLFDVKGQLAAKRALEVAAAGGHSVLLVGPPGTGKTMLAQRFAGILPPMTTDEALESAAVLSLVGQFAPQRWATRIFRSPHHTASAVALCGGGTPPMPGEISLAHHGVLFLDELPEFERRVLESLRQPLESGQITVSRAARQVDFPSRFQLIGAMNPCPCGFLGHASIECRCTPDLVSRYQDRISGPLLDRIDMRVEVAIAARRGHDFDARRRANALRRRARPQARTTAPSRGRATSNDHLQGAELEEVCAFDEGRCRNCCMPRARASAGRRGRTTAC